LGKDFEEAGLICGRDADAGVGDGEFGEEFLPRSGFDGEAEGDFAMVGEFDGVANEVDEDLAEAEFVGGDEREVGREGGDSELEALFEGAGAEEAFDLLKLGGEGEGGEADIDFAGFDFGQVEDFVEEAEEGFGGFVDGGGEFALGGGRLVWRRRPAMPRMPFMGVRISWLILARKADLARLAASAARRARRRRRVCQPRRRQARARAERPYQSCWVRRPDSRNSEMVNS
jgi:hypothetical protein